LAGHGGLDGRYLLEFQVIGASVKVSAIDPRTRLEVSIVGPSNAARADLSRAAVNKLEHMLRKRAQEAASSGSRGGFTV
jgi:hypothetical protein